MFKKIDLLYPLLALLLVLSPLAAGQDISSNITPSDAYDCTIVELDTVDEASLTTAEHIALMDASLLDSIDKHDNCIDQVVSDNAASGSGQGSGAGLAGADGESTEGENSSDASGGENGSGQSENTTEQANSEDATNKQRDNANQAGGNGAKNQDIAVKDNDSAVCRLLKDELKIETDPKKQSELKEIYNSYQCRG